MFTAVVDGIYNFTSGDIIKIPLPGGGYLGLSLLVIVLLSKAAKIRKKAEKMIVDAKNLQANQM